MNARVRVAGSRERLLDLREAGVEAQLRRGGAGRQGEGQTQEGQGNPVHRAPQRKERRDAMRADQADDVLLKCGNAEPLPGLRQGCVRSELEGLA